MMSLHCMYFGAKTQKENASYNDIITGNLYSEKVNHDQEKMLFKMTFFIIKLKKKRFFLGL